MTITSYQVDSVLIKKRIFSLFRAAGNRASLQPFFDRFPRETLL
jgi:hypothetical protein